MLLNSTLPTFPIKDQRTPSVRAQRFRPSAKCIMDTTDVIAGSSRLFIEAMVALTLRHAGNGDSTNGSSNGTPVHPRKRQRRSETWKRTVAKSKQAKGEQYMSLSTGGPIPARVTGPDCKCGRKCFGIEWSLQVKDKLVHQPMSIIRRLSLKFLPKNPMFYFYDILGSGYKVYSLY